jgi:hypothetical protein
MVDFVTREVGWKTDARYYALSYEVNERLGSRQAGRHPVTDLRKAIAADPKMKVMIVHGWDDLSCPYFASRLIVDQMPSYRRGAAGASERLSGRAHVLQPHRQRRGVPARCDGDVRGIRSSSDLDVTPKSPRPFALSEVEALARRVPDSFGLRLRSG